jgi:hypothetical protein
MLLVKSVAVQGPPQPCRVSTQHMQLFIVCPALALRAPLSPSTGRWHAGQCNGHRPGQAWDRGCGHLTGKKQFSGQWGRNDAAARRWHRAHEDFTSDQQEPRRCPQKPAQEAPRKHEAGALGTLRAQAR